MNKWLTLFAFTALGLVVGNVAGLSGSAVTLPLIAALFAFVGGSAIAFLKDVAEAQRSMAAIAIVGLSLGCLAGVYTGIIVREHQLLTPEERRFVSHFEKEASTETGPTQTNAYLRNADMQRLGNIDDLLRRRAITAEAAYDSLYDLIRTELEQ